MPPAPPPRPRRPNPLLAEWAGPYGGVPAFDRMDLADLEPALEAGMAKQLAEIDAIAADPAPPTFENTIVAMERSGRELGRVFTYWGIWSANLSTPEFRAIQAEMAPKLAELRLEDHPERGAVRARPRGARERRDGGPVCRRPSGGW
jgi:Zn-dependent oligopeptidase